MPSRVLRKWRRSQFHGFNCVRVNLTVTVHGLDNQVLFSRPVNWLIDFKSKMKFRRTVTAITGMSAIPSLFTPAACRVFLSWVGHRKSGSPGKADLAEYETFVGGDMAETRCLASKAQGKYCNRKITLLLIERSSKYCLHFHNLTKPGPGPLVWLRDGEDFQHVQASSHSRNEESFWTVSIF